MASNPGMEVDKVNHQYDDPLTPILYGAIQSPSLGSLQF